MKKLLEGLKISGCVIAFVISLSACNNGTKNTGKKSQAKTDSMSSINMQTGQGDSMKEHATAIVVGVFPDTTVTGTIQFDAQPDGKVKMTLQLTVASRANKSVAVHIHEIGDCTNMAKAAMGHWNPTNASHGKWGSSNFHSGDIGNISLDANGSGSLELTTDLWSLGGAAKTNILGKSIIVHSGVDDYTSQPAGNSGTRIGCGVIK